MASDRALLFGHMQRTRDEFLEWLVDHWYADWSAEETSEVDVVMDPDVRGLLALCRPKYHLAYTDPESSVSDRNEPWFRMFLPRWWRRTGSSQPDDPRVRFSTRAFRTIDTNIVLEVESSALFEWMIHTLYTSPVQQSMRHYRLAWIILGRVPRAEGVTAWIADQIRPTPMERPQRIGRSLVPDMETMRKQVLRHPHSRKYKRIQHWLRQPTHRWTHCWKLCVQDLYQDPRRMLMRMLCQARLPHHDWISVCWQCETLPLPREVLFAFWSQQPMMATMLHLSSGFRQDAVVIDIDMVRNVFPLLFEYYANDPHLRELAQSLLMAIFSVVVRPNPPTIPEGLWTLVRTTLLPLLIPHVNQVSLVDLSVWLSLGYIAGSDPRVLLDSVRQHVDPIPNFPSHLDRFVTMMTFHRLLPYLYHDDPSFPVDAWLALLDHWSVVCRLYDHYPPLLDLPTLAWPPDQIALVREAWNVVPNPHWLQRRIAVVRIQVDSSPTPPDDMMCPMLCDRRVAVCNACGHGSCMECLVEWSKRNAVPTCAYCRQPWVWTQLKWLQVVDAPP